MLAVQDFVVFSVFDARWYDYDVVITPKEEEQEQEQDDEYNTVTEILKFCFKIRLVFLCKILFSLQFSLFRICVVHTFSG